MMYDLTADDVAQIAEWYVSASGESAVRGLCGEGAEGTRQLAALLSKLGIEPTCYDAPYIQAINTGGKNE